MEALTSVGRPASEWAAPSKGSRDLKVQDKAIVFLCPLLILAGKRVYPIAIVVAILY